MNHWKTEILSTHENNIMKIPEELLRIILAATPEKAESSRLNIAKIRWRQGRRFLFRLRRQRKLLFGFCFSVCHIIHSAKQKKMESSRVICHGTLYWQHKLDERIKSFVSNRKASNKLLLSFRFLPRFLLLFCFS